jgi:hypothetical protein
MNEIERVFSPAPAVKSSRRDDEDFLSSPERAEKCRGKGIVLESRNTVDPPDRKLQRRR